MRIGLVIYGSLETLSGGYLYDRVLVEHLRAAGDTVEVISMPWRSYLRHLLDNGSGAALAKMRAARVDLLVQDELNHPSLFHLNRLYRRAGGAPLVAIVHHLRSSEPHPRLVLALYRRVERRYLQSVDGFVYNSQTTCRETRALRGSNAPGVVATPAGDRFGRGLEAGEITARVMDRARAGPPGRLLFAGNLIERKGLHTLLEALARPEARGWSLRVVGRDDLDPRYAARARRMAAGLEGRVRFLGRLPDEQLAAELRAADALVVPSSYEGFGIVYLEGMAFGLPAVAGQSGGAAEIITDGRHGFLVEPGNTGQLASALGKLLDANRLLAMSLAARQRFDEFPTWAESAGRVRDFFYSWR